MGADLIVSYLAIPQDKEPDWEGAREKVLALTKEEIEKAIIDVEQVESFEDYCRDYGYDPDNAIEEIRKRLSNSVNLAEEMWGGSRISTTWEIGGYQVMVTGEMSWGDSPEGCQAVWDLWEAGIAQAAGFAADPSKPPS